MEYMSTVPDKYFDLAVVDPPYGIGINVNMGRRKGDKKSDYHRFAGNDVSIPSKHYFEELRRISKDQIIWGGNYMTEYLPPSSCWLLWDKGFSEEVTFAQFELAWTSFITSAKKYDFNAAANRDRIHPTQKPIDLYKWLLKNYAKPEYKIIDTHLGSGSSAIAAYDFGINEFVGCEIDKEYYEAACKRFEIHKAQQKINFLV
jgi:site-specific DNA-methyltransferase (adenine-specific)